MLNWKVRANYEIPGLKWRNDHDGNLVGKIHTSWGTKFKRRAKLTFVPSIVLAIFTGLMIPLPTENLYEDLFDLFVSWFVGLYAFTLIWPFWPFSRALKFTRKQMTVGWRRYDLSDIGHFQTRQIKWNDDRYVHVFFTYGAREIDVRVAHHFSNGMDIAVFLNSVKREFLKLPSDDYDEDPRSADF